MDKKGLLLGLILLIQAACEPLVAESTDTDPPGLMERLAERAWTAKERVQQVGETVLGFAGAYYEDHLQPVAASYYEWTSTWRDSTWSLWNTMQTKMSSYMPVRSSPK
uniref:Apolipoprotein A-II n=1 Tax=Neogobius melanostomus TaxID=47308 RepID=A0A8C6WN97_9GOBI